MNIPGVVHCLAANGEDQPTLPRCAEKRGIIKGERQCKFTWPEPQSFIAIALVRAVIALMFVLAFKTGPSNVDVSRSSSAPWSAP